MSRSTVVAATPPVNGVTRDCDLQLSTNAGSMEIGAAMSSARNLRTGVVGSVNGILVNQSGAIVGQVAGRAVCNIPSALGNGACISYGIPVQTDQPTNANNPSAFTLRRGITRVVATLSATSSVTPNNDVGMQVMIGGGTLASLITGNGVGFGKSGFGIWMLTAAGGWVWAQKTLNDAINNLSDVVQISDAQNLVTAQEQFELRIYDSVPGGTNPSNYARVELWWKNLLFLTRYWTNPAGIVTQALPIFSATQGVAIYPQLRNTSTGPASVFAGDFSLIHGPNNEGTT